MTSIATRRNGRGAGAAADYSDSTDDESADRSDNEGQEGDSEYGSAEHSGSELSDRESGDAGDDDKKVDDPSNQGKQVIDHDEDRRNPQYIPKKGTFYEHDDRTSAGGENEESPVVGDETVVPDVVRTERIVSGVGEVEGKRADPVTPAERRKTPKSSVDRWLHDKYNETDQAPKSSEELMAVYGYDIRGEEGPPKAFRRHRYGRGPSKYTRNWEDEDAYSKGMRPAQKVPSVTNGKDFPALQPKMDRNRINKRKPDKKVHLVDNKTISEKITAEKITHTNKVFINKTNKIEKDIQEKPITEETSKWKSKGPIKVEPRKPAIFVKSQASQQEKMKWPDPPRLSSPPKPIPLINSQLQPQLPSAILPLPESKLPSAKKLTQPQIPPRLQTITPSQPSTATTTIPVAASTAATDANTKGKRYSSLRQRPMPDTHPSQQQQYITEYHQQPVQKQSSNQQPISPMTNLPHRQTPPPMLQTSSQHHQPMPQMHQPNSQPSLHQSNSQIHQQNAQLLQQGTQIHQQNTQLLQQANQLHQQNAQMHQSGSQLHQPSAPMHQQSGQMHQQPAQIHQQTPQIHQQSSQLHQQTQSIHQQTPPPSLSQSQTHHQTPPPSHQSLNRQQANISMRQVPRSHQQQMALHSMTNPAHLQGGLVTTQNYGSPGMLTPQSQYLQNANGPVYGPVVPQVYAAPPPQAYAAPQHQPMPPQAMPPPALPPQPMPPQGIPPQALQPHSYHHQTTAPQHQSPYASHTVRPVYREPSGITYYSPQEQKGGAPPTRRPTNAIPIVPPPPKERGKQADSAVPPPTDNIDHIVDNMFVPRQGRTGPSRPGETPPRTLDSTSITKPLDESLRQSEEKTTEEKTSKEPSPENLMARLEISSPNVETATVLSVTNAEIKSQSDSTPGVTPVENPTKDSDDKNVVQIAEKQNSEAIIKTESQPSETQQTSQSEPVEKIAVADDVPAVENVQESEVKDAPVVEPADALEKVETVEDVQISTEQNATETGSSDSVEKVDANDESVPEC